MKLSQRPLGALARGMLVGLWEYDAKTLVKDWTYRPVYGLTAAAASRFLEPQGVR